jgi:hypothetical protein
MPPTIRTLSDLVNVLTAVDTLGLSGLAQCGGDLQAIETYATQLCTMHGRELDLERRSDLERDFVEIFTKTIAANKPRSCQIPPLVGGEVVVLTMAQVRAQALSDRLLAQGRRYAINPGAK